MYLSATNIERSTLYSKHSWVSVEFNLGSLVNHVELFFDLNTPWLPDVLDLVLLTLKEALRNLTHSLGICGV